MKTVENTPDAARTIIGLRDTGYTLNMAVADIVDNSINAKAENIWITIEKKIDNQIKIRIIDDGYGMDEAGLMDAMKYGSKDKPDGNDLGRFGLGLKTASSSVCKRFTLVTRKGKKKPTLAARWDLDNVVATNKWLHEIGPAEGDHLDEFKQYVEQSGTMVCWDKVDRIGSYDDADKVEVTNHALGNIRSKLKFHLSQTFGRFIDKDGLKIHVNDQQLEAWDPFVLTEKTEKVINKKFTITLEGDSRKHNLLIEGYVVPNKYEYSTEDVRKRAKISNPNQGFYVYRENRMIIAGTWLEEYVQEPHFSLARLSLDFPRELDGLYQLDLKKSTFNLNVDIKTKLRPFVEAVRKEAEKRYRSGRITKTKGTTPAPHAPSGALITEVYEETTTKVDTTKVGEGKVEIRNPDGKIVIDMPTEESENIADLIKAVDHIDDGLFWEPALIGDKMGIHINRGHIYYDRVYIPNLNKALTIQGMDSLLWAMCIAEHEAVNKQTRLSFEKIRFEMSMKLRQLAKRLPELPEE
jgi:hypothetical protein